jgi:hypothetical protein
MPSSACTFQRISHCVCTYVKIQDRILAKNACRQ